MNKKRVVLDTNILISRLLKPTSDIATVVTAVTEDMVLLTSQPTFDELQVVVGRFVNKGYITPEEAKDFLAAFIMTTQWIPVLEHVEACRDPKNNKFLDLALNGEADYLITGDQDLLILHPFRGVEILPPPELIQRLLS